MDLSSFYTGSMAAPDKGPNGTLVQSQRYAPPPSSISDLYAGMYSETGAAPTKRTVQTTKVTPNYVDQNKNDSVVSKPAPQMASSYSTLDTVEPLDVNRLGLSRSPFDTSAQRAIAQATKPSGFTPVDPATTLSYGMLLDLFTQPEYSGFGQSADPGRIVAAPSNINTGDAWGGMRTAPAGAGRQGLVTGTPGGAPAAPAPSNNSPIAEMFGAHNTSSPEAFAASVTRPSNVPGVESFSGTVQQGQGGQNRYGSTAHNELLRLFT